ncbi:MAG: 3-deoxy-manno-octulosonate cytidylyltransferase [Arenicellales bacterium]
MPEFTVIIPARYEASRLPGKVLLDLVGKPVIAHVIERALASGAKVVVASDDVRIAEAVTSLNVEVVMTRADHQSGTDRIAEAVEILKLPDDAVIVNVQGDEPDMPPELIRQMAEALSERKTLNMCTACAPMDDSAMLDDPNVVKVVRDAEEMALYFSRAEIAFNRDGNDGGETSFPYRRHLGIYAYRAAYLKAFSATPMCALEKTEKLEQLRALYNGDKIYCPDAIKAPGVGIDTEADIVRARQNWEAK